MRLIATCPEELKAVVEAELGELGATELEPLYRAVAFTADPRLYLDAHLRLRTASRLLRVIKEVPATTPEMLASQARRLPWPELFGVERSFTVEALVSDRDSGAMSQSQIAWRVREAILEAFRGRLGTAPRPVTEEPQVIVVAHLRGGRCTLSFDTSGKALHKRGYRLEGHPAPLKETLASAILRLAGYRGTETFWDPLCGTGTLAIEAAQIALKKPPQIHRKKGELRIEWLPDFDRQLWRELQDRARAERLPAPLAPILASDASSEYVELAQKTSLRARVERDIQFSVARVEDAVPPTPTGLLVANLPYGERIGREDDLAALYGAIGDVLKQRFAGWRAALLVADASPWKAIGLRPDRRVPLMNGAIPCRLLLYEIYAGSRAATR